MVRRWRELKRDTKVALVMAFVFAGLVLLMATAQSEPNRPPQSLNGGQGDEPNDFLTDPGAKGKRPRSRGGRDGGARPAGVGRGDGPRKPRRSGGAGGGTPVDGAELSPVGVDGGTSRGRRGRRVRRGSPGRRRPRQKSRPAQPTGGTKTTPSEEPRECVPGGLDPLATDLPICPGR
jgi:hypothetical protein